MTTAHPYTGSTSQIAAQATRSDGPRRRVDMKTPADLIPSAIGDSDLLPATGTGWAHLPGQPPDPLLSLLTHCYASGVYGSEDIADAIREDPLLRGFCSNQLPEARELRRFRRAYRDRLTGCLSRVLAQSAVGTLPQSGRGHTRCSYLSASLDRWSNRGQVPRIDAACVAEAERRIRHAIQMDSAALDD